MHRAPSPRRPGLLLLAFVVLLAAAVGPGPRPVAAAGFAPLAMAGAHDRVSLRMGPGPDWEVLSDLAPGTTVALLDGPTNGWYRVQAVAAPDRRGWTPGDRLVWDRYAATTGEVNLFAGPGVDSALLAVMPAGTVITVVGPATHEFVAVRYGDQSGFAYAPWFVHADGPPTTPPVVPTGEHWVDVNRSTWQVRLMIGTTAVATYAASLGHDPGQGFYATASGTYSIYSKTAGLSYTPYANAYIMYWAGFDPARNNGFHAWTMDATGAVIPGGAGATGGCVATAPAEAAAVFDFVQIGTRVEIHY